MESSRPYPIGIQDFAKLREGGFLYVDKTQYVTLARREGKFFFLSRPRRFGKSLFLSTLAAFYRGERELFRGLEAYADDWDWQPRPVLYVDLNTGTYTSAEGLEARLDDLLGKWERTYGIEPTSTDLAIRFGNVIQQACESTGHKVVILVDEYDKPLLSAIGNAKLADRFRETLKAFYSNIKTLDRCIEMAFLTGVGRFSKISIFSDLNNLRDITFDNKFAAICGITSEELETHFTHGITSLGKEHGMTRDETRRELQLRYDGYHFSSRCPDIYNPFSLLNVFASLDFGSYWFSTGTPTFLTRMVRDGRIALRDLSGCRIGMAELADSGILSGDTIPAFYQTGYLTIKDSDMKFRKFTLDYPNREVKEGFLEALLPMYTGLSAARSEFAIERFITEVEKGDTEGFMRRLESLVAKVPYSSTGNAPESHFQNLVYLVFTLMGYYTDMELRTASGRMDILVKTPDYIYVIELKTKSTAEDALEQARDRGYALPYAADGRTIVIIGTAFNPATRRLDGWLAETIPPVTKSH